MIIGIRIKDKVRNKGLKVMVCFEFVLRIFFISFCLNFYCIIVCLVFVGVVLRFEKEKVVGIVDFFRIYLGMGRR